MREHNSTGYWDAVAFYVVLAVCGMLLAYGAMYGRHGFCASTTIRACDHHRAEPADGATPRPAHRAP